MKTIVFLLTILAVGIAVAYGSDLPSNHVNGPTVNSEALQMPKMFDFKHFKSVFKKKYSSVLEELAREKIFLGRAFRAFLSLVGFKHYNRSTYLKINDMSDWTEAESKALYTRRPINGASKAQAKSASDLRQTPVASIEDIRAHLSVMAAKNKAVSEELNSQFRRRRSTTNGGSQEPLSRESISVQNLIPDSIETDSERENDNQIPSSNPHYQPPELTSFGTEDISASAPSLHGEADYSLISSLPGASYISSLISGAGSYLFGSGSEVRDHAKLALSNQSGHRKERFPNRSENVLEVDHRKNNCLVKPKNQRGCGSCYIFSTTALYEWHYCKELGESVAFSEQYPLDCGERAQLNGCNGGLEYEVAAFYGKFGLEMKHNYPYRAQSDICPYDTSAMSTVMGYVKLAQPSGAMLRSPYEFIEEILRHSPVLMGLGVSDEFGHYGGGVDMGEGCKEDNGHSMLIVGMGKEDGVEYYLFRNSYGTNWGENGYYRLAKSAWKDCLLDDGEGYFLATSQTKPYVFKKHPNQRYNPNVIEKRNYDIKHQVSIPHNPFTYISEEDQDPNAVVNKN